MLCLFRMKPDAPLVDEIFVRKIKSHAHFSPGSKCHSLHDHRMCYHPPQGPGCLLGNNTCMFAFYS